ncbi:MAG: hypothetical protein JST84_05935 [Acidobacteria bacterium]|nr:hypothetical protein [Acidobacteriota bacterium]
MTTKAARRRVFCLRHQEVSCSAEKDLLIRCDQDHVLSENLRKDRWEHCFSCRTFIPRQEHVALAEQCASCDRRVSWRYLCDQCDCLSFATNDAPADNDAALSQPGYAACPCCLSRLPVTLRKHSCPGLKAAVLTSRVHCSSCGESIAPDEFPAPWKIVTADTTQGPGENKFVPEEPLAGQAQQGATQPNGAKADGEKWFSTWEDRATAQPRNFYWLGGLAGGIAIVAIVTLAALSGGKKNAQAQLPAPVVSATIKPTSLTPMPVPAHSPTPEPKLAAKPEPRPEPPEKAPDKHKQKSVEAKKASLEEIQERMEKLNKVLK